MQIQISHLMPIPLQEKLRQRHSDIWNQDVSFKPGTFVKIKAPSGTGKTTLIHYLYHIRNDYTGSVSFANRPWPAYSKNELAAVRQQQLSVIFQDLRLFEQLTALENIELKRTMLPNPYCTTEKIREMAAQLNVSHVLQQSGKTLSYGERQRIAIIRALAQPFQWLLMDEPFSHLDEENTRLAAALIARECKDRQAGFILTDLDHDQHFIYDVHYQL
ncbi:ATP-binding cassette domain-containing protein [Chitinophaga nivalis]|uniref:ATP-binding cassette domain-containing protein n=1 Tax=Chitinophaga nivalis TaxID=2991709 RepID=A0ABT3IVF6_9BACT|nr:ATP-binding cassette domain-containing protein [Chitinophaga nivalis]MCW3462340.1 ATP-binding cassette domain-containing protein [Chitinophaga nivalis]MCW3487969.1 ATP-binding cassette domain-containing protein [Chitinophaga nivalis]